MLIPSDYKELLSALNKRGAKYLIVGAYAVIYYTEPRYTKDLDIWVGPEIENAAKVYEALKQFGAPLRGLTPADFTKPSLVYQIGVDPVRVDILMGIPGLDFNTAWQRRKRVVFEGVDGSVIGIEELMRSKKKANRPMDLVDIGNLSTRLKSSKRRKK
ncbi:MAG: hypothetical protein AUJ74_00820 [Candidatus Omnitrophica bacterium CG1_02_44_16]|nr:MAG: hypothetical protein AUJ74_00820 [Candidatus Omnitrophica bacterium CG1_02_44_16]